MLSKYLPLFVVCFLVTTLSAAEQDWQGSTVTWAYAYSFSDGINEQGPAVTHITPTKDGGYLLSGGNYLFKIDRLGRSQWQKMYYCGPCRIESTVQTSDGGYLSANVYDDLTSSYIFVYRLDSTGNVQWARTFRRRLYDKVNAVIGTRDGGYLLGGFSSSYSSGRDGRMWLLKLSGGGKLQWQRTYNVAEATSLAQLSNGDFLVGTSYLSVLRVTLTGKVRWQRKYVSPGCCEKGIVRPTPDGGYLLAGESTTTRDTIVIKSSISGAIEYSRRLPLQSFDDLTVADAGYYFVLADRSGSSRALITQFGSSGDRNWTKQLYSDAIHALTIAASQDGGVLLGTFQSTLIKADSNANVVPCKTLFVPSSMPVKTITVSVETRVPNVQQSPIKVLFYSTNPAKNLGGGGQSVCSQ